jgi:transposase-like protein
VTSEFTLVRSDTLPEALHWSKFWEKNDGCKVSPSCLTCPLPDCVKERATAGKAEHRVKKVNLALMWRHEHGFSVTLIASRLKVTRGTVHRWIAQAAAEAAEQPATAEEPPAPAQAPPRATEPLIKARRPLPELRPGYKRSAVLYEGSV